MNQIVCCDWLPEWARWCYLARSGLPVVSREKNFPESQIINPLWTKLFWSRWLGIAGFLENLESPGILLWHFSGLESPKKGLLVLESAGNLLNLSEKYEMCGRQ